MGGRGSGFFIGKAGENPEYLITNRHVVDYYLENGKGERIDIPNDDGSVIYARAHIRVYYDENDYQEAFVVEAGDSSDRDYAILKLSEPTEKRAPLPLELPSDDLKAESVLSFGFPGAADNEAVKPMTSASEKDVVAERGTFNKLFTITGTGVQTIQHSATIHHGNSGGPLILEKDGAVIGVASSSFKNDDTNVPLYYAISTELLIPALDRNNVPYMLVGEIPPTSGMQWYVYAIIGVAIVIVIILLAVLLKKKQGKAPKPEHRNPGSTPVPKPQPVQPQKRRLIGVNGPLKNQTFDLPAGGKLLIGRDKSCNVRIPDETKGVSNFHCEIKFDGTTATITDLKSSFGTFVDHKKLMPNVPLTLHRSLEIELGSDQVSFVLQ